MASAISEALGSLTIGNPYRPLGSGGLFDQDDLEALDAAWEDANGRLPHEPGYEERMVMVTPRLIAWGIDPSTKRVSLGWVGAEQGTRTRSLRSDLVQQPGARLWHIYQQAYELCRDVHEFAPPDVVYVEQPFGRTVMPIAQQAMGVVMAAVWRVTGADAFAVGPSSWKLSAIGKGSADKSEILAWARSRGYTGSLQDEADALGIAEAARLSATPRPPRTP